MNVSCFKSLLVGQQGSEATAEAAQAT